MLCYLPPVTDPNVIVGRDASDDAAVYRLSDELAVVMTLDYFTPIVDDPRDFGAIAAANALSDVYAMGGRPVAALNLAGFPVGSLPLSALGEILAGGAEKAAEAGVAIVGGHTYDDREPKYGLSVVGLIHPDKVVKNAGAMPGDRLILTKPLGIGIITSGIKAKQVSEETTRTVVGVMTTLNRAASEAMIEVGVHACTDITGFGLLGHLREVTLAGGIGARVCLSKVPVLPETWALVKKGIVPGGARRNLDFVSEAAVWDPAITEEHKLVLCDPQTSGGLLMAVPPESVDALLQALASKGVVVVAEIGEIVEDAHARIWVQP